MVRVLEWHCTDYRLQGKEQGGKEEEYLWRMRTLQIARNQDPRCGQRLRISQLALEMHKVAGVHG